jgi:hypothetical protein
MGAAPTPDALAARLERAQTAALRYFATSVETADPSWLSLFGYMHRRFGVDARLASGASAHTVRDGVARPEVYAIYRRIDDPDAQVDKAAIAALPTAIDRITASALHCDRIPLPADWVEILAKASRAGAYALTHAVLATEWTVENGCRTRQDVTALHAEQVRLLEQLIEQRATARESVRIRHRPVDRSHGDARLQRCRRSHPRGLDRRPALAATRRRWVAAPSARQPDPTRTPPPWRCGSYSRNASRPHRRSAGSRRAGPRRARDDFDR